MREERFPRAAVPHFSAGVGGADAASGIRQLRRSSDAMGDAKRALGRRARPLPGLRVAGECSFPQSETLSRLRALPARRRALTPQQALIRLVRKTFLKTGTWAIQRAVGRRWRAAEVSRSPRRVTRLPTRSGAVLAISNEPEESWSVDCGVACGSLPPPPTGRLGPPGTGLAGFSARPAMHRVGQESER